MRTYSEKEALNVGLGQAGFEYISDVVERNNVSYVRIDVITSATFSILDSPLLNATSNTMTGVSFPAGTTLYGKFTRVKLSAGSVIAYNG